MKSVVKVFIPHGVPLAYGELLRYDWHMPHPNLPDFTPTVAAAEVQPQQVTLYQWGERRFILTRLDGQVYAFSSECPHASGDMSASTISRKGRIDCPDHGYVFDIRSGRITWPADENYCLRQYPVKEIDGVVWVQLPVTSQPYS